MSIEHPVIKRRIQVFETRLLQSAVSACCPFIGTQIRPHVPHVRFLPWVLQKVLLRSNALAITGHVLRTLKQHHKITNTFWRFAESLYLWDRHCRPVLELHAMQAMHHGCVWYFSVHLAGALIVTSKCHSATWLMSSSTLALTCSAAIRNGLATTAEEQCRNRWVKHQ